MGVQKLAVAKARCVWAVRLEVDVRCENIACASSAQLGGVEVRLEEEEGKIGVVEGGHVRDNGGNFSAAFERGTIVGVEQGKEVGEIHGGTRDCLADFTRGHGR